MKWKNRLTNYNFWISIVSAVLLIMQAFEFQFDIAYINEIATAVLGLLVVIGIISDPTKTYNQTDAKKEDNPKENSVKEEDKVTEKPSELETLEMPIETENKSDYGYNKDDFQALINKISQDISENFIKIKEMQNNIVNDFNLQKNAKIDNENSNSTEEQESKIETPAETIVPTHINIVN